MPWLEQFLSSVAPEGRKFTVSVPFADDEVRWFKAGVEASVFRFGRCTPTCPRLKRWGRSGDDEFITPDGQPRHIFGFSGADETVCHLGREYIAHVAAVSRLIVQKRFDGRRHSFSRYRTFTRDLVTKRRGQRFETDAEFFGVGDAVFLQVEAKKSRPEVESIARQLEVRKDLGALSDGPRKELEYVLELRPRFLWLVGPGLVEPEQFVYEVEVSENDARFKRIDCLPPPPSST